MEYAKITTKTQKRSRSPNYPNYGLKDCIEFLEKLYKKYKTNEVHTDDAITQMGHSTTSSSAGRVLASMFSFGLLESRGSKEAKFVQVTRLAQGIILEENNSLEKFELLQKAALHDDSMQMAWAKWKEKIPAEETIKKILQLEMGYSPEGAKRFARVIIETYEFSQLSKPLITDDEDDETPILQTQSNNSKSINTRNINEIDTIEENKKSARKAIFLLANGREIVIYAPNDLTNIEFELTLKWLELQKYGLVSTQEKKTENSEE